MSHRVRIAAEGGSTRAPAKVRRVRAVLGLVCGLLLGVPATAGLTPRAAEEPVILTGSWVGTWWIGKYEEPVELELTHTRRSLEGQVTLWGYPRAGSTSAAAPVRAPVAGTVDGDRVELTWTMPEQGPFRAELKVVSRTTLFGVGGPGHITTGFELRRAR